MSTIVRMLAKARSRLLRSGVRPEDTDDILQEAFARLEAYTQSHELKSKEAFLITVALNISKDQARYAQRWGQAGTKFDFDALIDAAPGAEEVLEARERLRRMQAGLAQLSPQVLRVLIAQRLDGLSYKDIGEREAITPGAAQKQVARAMIFLVKWMDDW